jgi:DUF3014 family protein
MENWSVPEGDRPYIRPARSFNPWLVVAAIGIVAWLGAFYFRYWLEPASKSAEPAAPLAQPAAPAPAPGLIGGRAFADLVVPYQLVRRIVATVDNLPRRTAPTRVMPLNPVPGAFAADGDNAEGALAETNYARYAPYVRVIEAIDAPSLINAYVRTYPLFQRAYEQLGYPGKYFNDRLIEAIDDLLAAPDLDTPPKLIRPKVLYEFADPDLETRSAGQKIMLRMGAANAALVKAKLFQIRREILAASQKK